MNKEEQPRLSTSELEPPQVPTAVTPEANRRDIERFFTPPSQSRIDRSPTRGTDSGSEDTVTDTDGATGNSEDSEPIGKEEELFIMYSPRTTVELPTIKTGRWPYGNQNPSPITIHKARKLLAAAYAIIPCEINGTGVNGHAWIIESEDVWGARKGTTPVKVPKQPLKVGDYSFKAQRAYDDDMAVYKLYNHLIQEGKDKIIEWFGEAMFLDLYVDELLPNDETPRSLLKHLEDTYSNGNDHRRLMEEVRKKFETPYDPGKPVEVYFMHLQEARTNASLLGEPFTDKQTMNRALQEFDKHYEKDAYKAEKKWNARTDKTWAAFKRYWKEEIHQWEVLNKNTTRQANAAARTDVDALSARVNNMEINMEALQTENHTYKERNEELLAQQVEFRQALQTEQQQRGSVRDDVSALTYRSGYLAGMNAHSAPQPNGGNSDNDGNGGTLFNNGNCTPVLLRNAQNRAPDAYRESNEGRGRKFNKYCWYCGCNCTHWTRKCYELNNDQKARYRDANFNNTMGGSTKYLDRKGKWQADYNFDSL